MLLLSEVVHQFSCRAPCRIEDEDCVCVCVMDLFDSKLLLDSMTGCLVVSLGWWLHVVLEICFELLASFLGSSKVIKVLHLNESQRVSVYVQPTCIRVVVVVVDDVATIPIGSDTPSRMCSSVPCLPM
jgi:hypothetical protein